MKKETPTVETPTLTVAQYFKENNLDLKYDGESYLMDILPWTQEKHTIVINDPEYKNAFGVKVIKSRLKVFDLEDTVDESAIIYSLFLNLNTPAKMVIYLISILEKVKETGIPATMDMATGLFPNGFYDDETVRIIIDECMKKRKTVFSEIYIQN
jgi:hypothetical protein